VFEMSGNTITPINTMSFASTPSSITALPRGLPANDGALVGTLPAK